MKDLDRKKAEAILAKDKGMPYSAVLSMFNLLPRQFYAAVQWDLETLIQQTKGDETRALKEIKADKARKLELFRMDEEFLIEQYERRMGMNGLNVQASTAEGTYLHPQNVEDIAYYALTLAHPKLLSKKRRDVMEGIYDLPNKLAEQLTEIGLQGLKNNALKGSNLGVVQAFDRARMRKTGQRSIFDLSSRYHVHEWEVGGAAPQGYWKRSENVEKAVYHLLTENHRGLKSSHREKVISAVLDLPNNLAKHLFELGLVGAMDSFPYQDRGSPLAILRVYDRVRMRIAKDPSIFDLTQKYHVHEWEVGGAAPQGYWKKRSNVINAVYHVLAENYPDLGSSNRETVVSAICRLPVNIQKFMHQNKLSGMMTNAFPTGEKDSIVGVMRAFDEAYRMKPGNESLFDSTKSSYIEIYVANINKIRAVFRNS